jgi:hypothetical protein
MIGDLIIWVKKFVKQHITCRHDYKFDRIGIITSLCYDRICTKCDKTEKI